MTALSARKWSIHHIFAISLEMREYLVFLVCPRVKTNKKSSSNNNSTSASCTCKDGRVSAITFSENKWKPLFKPIQIITRLTEISGLVYDTLNCEHFLLLLLLLTRLLLATAAIHRAIHAVCQLWRKGKKVCSSNGDKLASNQLSSFDGNWPWFAKCAAFTVMTIHLYYFNNNNNENQRPHIVKVQSALGVEQS